MSYKHPIETCGYWGPALAPIKVEALSLGTWAMAVFSGYLFYFHAAGDGGSAVDTTLTWAWHLSGPALWGVWYYEDGDSAKPGDLGWRNGVAH